MKNLIFLILTLFLFTSCSIEDEETLMDYESSLELNAQFQDEGCDIVIVENFGDFGQFHITNDHENLYITVAANEGLALENAKLHIAEDYSGFPTVGKGNLPPGQMEINESFDPPVAYKDYSFSLEDLDFEGDDIVIASKANFIDGSENFSAWAGDIPGAKGNWYYLEYSLQNCQVFEEPCTISAGQDNSVELPLSYVLSEITTLEAAKDLYLSLLDEGVSRDGYFNPTIDVLAALFNEYTVNNFTTDSFTTTYTIEEGDCKDSTDLTVLIYNDYN